MYLQRASDEHVPADLAEFLRELGDGEGGFGGTPFGCGDGTLEDFLRACRQGEDPSKVAPGHVPQTVFWMIDDAGRTVGMVRMRHCLNDRLIQSGGHVGYYVRQSDRQKGYATAALRIAVAHLRHMGVGRVLVTVDPANEPSTRVVLANGGRLDGQGHNPGGEIVNRYWIE